EPHLQSGKLRALAVANPTRLARLPEVPTTAEAGLPQYQLASWFGLAAPAGAPRDAIDRVNAEARKALAMADVRESLAKPGHAPGGFEEHPHRGMQTVTFVLEGALEHRDHTGAHGVLRAGDVQWMTAGRGVLHSEMPHGGETAHTLQLWLNLPRAMKMMPARY